MIMTGLKIGANKDGERSEDRGVGRVDKKHAEQSSRVSGLVAERPRRAVDNMS